jgi:3-hydroxymyristoyl/3-hydroxydecanoyl-(acyl carrier protein) dehydratase
LIEKRKPLANADLWLVSGGGSGVTASSIIALSEASPNVGAIFLLLGRSTLLAETKDWLDYDEDQLQMEKMALRERMTEASESGKITMVEWNKEWQNLTRSLDIRRTIQAIELAGNKAEYHSADVTDVASIKSAIDNRSVTGIVHGAGLEDSKLVAEKSWEIFDRVVRVKVDGWRALISAAGEHVRFACAFTSVAGRFGNGGQTDYAAANSVLDAEMARLSAKGGMRAVAIGWTGWRDVGMATRGSIEAIFAASGIDTLSVGQGVEIFVDEVLSGGKRRVLGCGSLGLMDRYSSFRESPLLLPGEMAVAISDPRRFPFVDKILSFKEGKSLISQTTLSVADHPFLGDHAIEGVPYHPGVMALEMFSENSLLLCHNTCLAGFEDVKFGLPIKLLKGAMTIRTEVEVLSSSQDITRVSCRIVSDLVNSKGEIFGEPRVHHHGIVRLTERKDDLTVFMQSEIDGIPAIGIPADGEILHHPSFIYLRYFHGPRFQSHGGVLRGVGDSINPGVDGLALMRHQLPAKDQFAIESEGEEVLLDCLPMLIEAGFQNAGLVAMESEGASSLPIGIDWSTFLRVPDQGERLRLRSVLRGKEDGGVTVHDVVVVGDDHAPVIALKGLRLKAMAPVPKEQMFSLER